MSLSTPKMAAYRFLAEMYDDAYFPDTLVKKGEDILVELCQQIEQQKPAFLDELYALTHAATDRFNELQEEFDEQGSEIETVARECIAADFEAIAHAYGFENADTAHMITTRDW